MKRFSSVLLGSVVCGFSFTSMFANAVTVDINSAHWGDLVRGSNLSFVDSDGLVGTEEIRWGTPVRSGGEASGYRFDVNTTALASLQPGQVFTLGTLTHFNHTIKRGGGIKFASLFLGLEITDQGERLGGDDFGLRLRHRETTNDCDPQPHCADDRVNITEIDASRLFINNGMAYSINVLGFDADNSTSLIFSSPEGEANSVELLAQYDAVEISEPKMLGVFSFAAFFCLALRRKKDTAHFSSD